MVDFLTFAQELIRFPSVTHTPQKDVLDALEAALTPLGFHCERFMFSEEGFPEVENMYAVLNEGSDRHLCFGGHVDVVPAGDESAWTSPPYTPEIRDGFLYGRGTEDMKGAIACFVSAVAAFLESSERTSLTDDIGTISLLIAGDEEGSGRNGTKKVLAELQRLGRTMPSWYLVGEPTNVEHVGDMAKIGRRGSLNCDLTVRGKQGHVAYQHLADNPVTKLVRILNVCVERELDKGTEHFLPSNLEISTVDVGNPAVNVIPGEARAQFNIRFNTEHDARDLKQWIEDTCKSYADDAILKFHISGEPFLTAPGKESAIVEQAVTSVTGITPALTTTGGTSDARFFKDYGPVVEFGTTGKRAHQVNERVALADLEALQRCYLAILQGYFSS